MYAGWLDVQLQPGAADVRVGSRVFVCVHVCSRVFVCARMCSRVSVCVCVVVLLAGKGMFKGHRCVLDGCNPTAADRKAWLALAMRPSGAVCVFFDADSQLCTERAGKPNDSVPLQRLGTRLEVAYVCIHALRMRCTCMCTCCTCYV